VARCGRLRMPRSRALRPGGAQASTLRKLLLGQPGFDAVASEQGSEGVVLRIHPVSRPTQPVSVSGTRPFAADDGW
jgi:hypothetical protein